MPPTTPATPTTSSDLLDAAQQYADLFNAAGSIDDVDQLIADACVDPFWDDRTNLLSLLADDPQDLGLVLASSPDDYVVVRYLGGEADGKWVVDTSPVDWDALEDEAFDADA
ncbi:MAG: hypothetical protein QOK39_241 [Acidimicrobiaceae bacterium]|jgi:hypothetical protein|nr:hypothetical protein [Acidimicrobiaceae bacterium]